MNRTSFYAALALLSLIALPAAAQGREPSALPPHEIVTMINSTQFEPIGQPTRRGPNYLLRALDQYDREVTLTINAHSGQITAVTPMQTASRMPPPSGPPGGRGGEWQRLPPGYVPPPAYRSGVPVIIDDEDDLPPPAYGSRPGAPAAPPRAGQPSAPIASAAEPPDDEAEPRRPGLPNPTVIPADPDQGGLLPPPPERFPQRVAPAGSPKPVQRAAAAPSKTAPLPRPKPTAPPSAAPQPAPAKKPQADDTPH